MCGDAAAPRRAGLVASEETPESEVRSMMHA